MKKFLISLCSSLLLLTGCVSVEVAPQQNTVVNDVVQEQQSEQTSIDIVYSDINFSLSDGTKVTVKAYNGKPYAEVNNNVPYFTDKEKTTEVFENYSELDELGRCGVAYANICIDIMPTEPRGAIGQVKPSGWHTVKYDCVDGKYLYNRCHLIGFQLAGENANPKNLITGTRYLNIDGMLEHENWIDNYVETTKNHVLYRVTPIFNGKNLVADGVLMEGYSVEDNGNGVEFCIFAYNVQPGVRIDYETGDSCLAENTFIDEVDETILYGNEKTFILNTNSNVFHKEDCSSVKTMSEQNRVEYLGIAEELMLEGYKPCGKCKPDLE